ncbi:MAG: tetratricopeptide repeat protein [candidate division Zixibacteria bacterium]|nr:tetratricopeptide repeat protein [candidate division Zixibacteria bacterium]
MNPPAKKSPDSSPATFDSALLFRLLGALILIHLVGAFLPVTAAWGFNYWNLAPLPMVTVFLLAALVLLVPPVSEKVSRLFLPLFSRITAFLKDKNRNLTGLAGLAVAFAFFYLFRSEAFVYGDGFTRLEGYAVKEGPIIYDKLYLEVGSIVLPHYLYRLLDYLFGLSHEQVYALVTCLGGTVGVWALYAISQVLAEKNLERWFIFLGALTSGAVILFFGYIENYTWSTVMVLWTLHRALKYVQGKSRFRSVLFFSAAAVFFHLVTTPVLAIAILAPAVRKAAIKKHPLRPLVWKIGLIGVVGSFGVVLAFQYSNLPMIFTPLWPVADIPYWFFSSAHLLDFLNQVILVAPLGGIVALMMVVSTGFRLKAVTPEGAILSIATAATLIASFWVDPEIGAIRDWDLISLFGFPFSLWGVYTLLNLKTANGVRPAWLFSLVVVILVTIIPNLAEKNNLTAAVDRVDTNLWSDSHYQLDYKKANRCVSWGYILYINTGEQERSVKYFLRNLKINPNSYQALANLGEVYYDRQIFDSANIYLKRLQELDPDNPRYLDKLAHTEQVLGNRESSLKYLIQAERADSTDSEIQANLGMLYSQLGQYDEALVRFRRAYRSAPGIYKNVLNLALAFNNLQMPESTVYYYNLSRTLEDQIPTDDIGLLTKLIYIEKSMGNFQRALDFADRVSLFQPGNAEIHNQRGLLLSAMKRYREAIAPFRKGVALEPENCMLTLYLGLAYDKTGNRDSAFYYLDKSLALCGDNVKQGYIYEVTFNNALALGKFDKAREVLEALEKLNPDTNGLAALRGKLRDATGSN